jgi:uncharacterized protein YbjQ (UPF0145 family)
MERREFLQCANLCGAGLLGLGAVASAQAAEAGKDAAAKPSTPMTIRPYQLVCTVCSLGEQRKEPVEQYEKCKQIRDAVRKNPDMPMTLACHAGDLYAYQESGTKDDTPESEEFNRKRDLDVLQILGMAPGCTLPARAFFKTFMMGVSTVSGLCNYHTVTGTAWKGCPKANSGNYERAHEKGIAALIPPRGDEEMANEKKKSLEALNSATVVPVRPHILACAVCQYGDGLRPGYKEDNLPELLDLIINRNPDLPIKMAPGADWMICAPCPGRNPELKCCTHVWGSGDLASQQRDLNFLQKLGLKYGSTIKARDLYRLIFERITTTHGVPDMCLKYNTMPSVWWDECGCCLYGANAHVKYEKGKRELMEKMKLNASS